MRANFINIFKKKLKSTDILFECRKSFPNEFREHRNDNDFDFGLYMLYNHYCAIGYHGTRLFDCEYENIKKYGFQKTNEDCFINKANLIEHKEYREYIVNYLKSLRETQSDGRIYMKFGNNDFSSNNNIDTIFLNNWGGETIYKCYDKGGSESDYEKEIGNYLRYRSRPYVVVCRVIVNFSNKDEFYRERIENKKGFSAAFYTEDIEIVDVIPVSNKLIEYTIN